MPNNGGTVQRATVSLRQRDVENLDAVADSLRVSRNDAIRQSLASQAFLNQVTGRGGKLLVQDSDGRMSEVQFVG